MVKIKLNIMPGRVIEFPYQEIANKRTEEGLRQYIENYERYGASETHCVTGPMKSCKSRVLLAMYDYLIESGVNNIALFQNVLNTRDGGKVKTRNGEEQNAFVASTAEDIYRILISRKESKVSVADHLKGKYVFIDELQFFDDKIIDLLQDFRAMEVNTFVSFLNQDFRGEPFAFQVSRKFELFERLASRIGFSEYVHRRHVGNVLASTASIVNMSAVYPPNMHATMSMKMTDSTSLVEAGDEDKYTVVPPSEHPYVIKRLDNFR